MSDRAIHYESAATPTPRDPRARARSAEARQTAPPTSEPRLERRRRTADPLYYPPHIVPQSMSYEWKRRLLMGQPDNPHWVGLRENHWSPVPAERHQELAMAGDSQIIRGDLVLCERPKYLTEEAQYEDMQEGISPLRHMEEAMFGTREGEFTRNHPSVRRASHVNQKYAAQDPYGAHEPAPQGGGIPAGGLSLEP